MQVVPTRKVRKGGKGGPAKGKGAAAQAAAAADDGESHLVVVK